MTAAENSIMVRLRSATRTQHDRAERAEFQQRMIMGRVSAREYCRYLCQLYLVHETLESTLRRASGIPSVARILRDHQFKRPNLAADLMFFGVPVDSVPPLAATLAVIDQIERTAADSEVAVLGFHYVLEGSANGGKYLARSIAKGLRLAPNTGVSYLDPYGDRQHELWGEFRRDMDAAAFAAADADAIVEAAKAMFSGIIDISEQMLAGAAEPAALVGV